MPAEYRANFLHLYLDVAWFGVLGGSTLAFVAVFAARQGADALQIGLLSAGPAIVNLMLALPTGRWLEGRPIGVAVFWSSVFYRVFYLLWVLLPSLLWPQAQVWALIGFTLLMSVPGSALAIGFNAMFASAVPLEWRGHVVGIRNALLAVTYTLTTLVCGQILHALPFPLGYQVVFGIGALGAGMSSLHLWFVTPRTAPGERTARGLRALRRVQQAGTAALATGTSIRQRLRVEVLRGPYGKLMAVLFAFHLTQYLPLSLFALYWVNYLHLSDQDISLGTALFYVMVFLGSSRFDWAAQRLGNQRVTALGALFISAYPALLAASQGLALFLVASVLGGLGSALLGGALINYLLEKAPENDLPAHMAWYNLTLNAAILIGSLVGPFLGEHLGFTAALALLALFRVGTAILIWRWE